MNNLNEKFKRNKYVYVESKGKMFSLCYIKAEKALLPIDIAFPHNRKYRQMYRYTGTFMYICVGIYKTRSGRAITFYSFVVFACLLLSRKVPFLLDHCVAIFKFLMETYIHV